MGLYLLNTSVDTVDPNPEHIPEDLSYNDQESILEIFIEQVLGYEDAIKEYDDHDTKDHNKKKNVNIDFLVYISKTNNYTQNQPIARKNLYPDYKARLTSGFIEIACPPPKV